MSDICASFQHTVGEYLVRHRSILDTLTKLQESNSRVNRAVAKAVTTCGCITVEAGKQQIPDSMNLLDYKEGVSSHLSGHICDHCMEVLEVEIGNHLFYLAAVCETLGLDLGVVIKKEMDRVAALGLFKMS